MKILSVAAGTWLFYIILYIWRKSLSVTSQECCNQYWTTPGGRTPQSSNCQAIYYPSQKLFQVRRTRHAGHWWRSRDELISNVLLWTPLPGRVKAGRLARTYSSVQIQDVALKTYPKRWTMEGDGERGPGRSVPMAWHDIYIYIYIYIYNRHYSLGLGNFQFLAYGIINAQSMIWSTIY